MGFIMKFRLNRRLFNKWHRVTIKEFIVFYIISKMPRDLIWDYTLENLDDEIHDYISDCKYNSCEEY
jgi:hypothetical protein